MKYKYRVKSFADNELNKITVIGKKVTEQYFEETFMAKTNNEALEIAKKANPTLKDAKAFGPDATKSKELYKKQLIGHQSIDF